ncbi:hypothetical protein V9K67_13675 [Paraflavisolibacter sp. H34]|uniref:hypothetical protein n=1 Tax=Huijunlia imazamoxiresistens TaxID=3127457 RepID=UPI00301A8C57
MRWMKWVGIAAAIALIVSLYFPWIVVPGKNIVISGMHAEGTTYGKPGYLNIIMVGLYLVFALIPRLWAVRINIFVAAINLTWSLRNFILLSRCEAGECPERQPALYLFLFFSALVLLSALFNDPGKKAHAGE